jgi:hypothetical protein
MLYVDDNLMPLTLTNASQLSPIFSLYNKYTGDCGLNINIVKTIALCINTPAPLCDQLCLLGMTTPDNAKHLGI